MKFYLGTHKPHWLGLSSAPLFVSRRTLCQYRTPPRAKVPWALDSGGFSELLLFGRWTTAPEQYALEVAGWMESVGQLDFAAVQDWMCEPFMLSKTGKTLREHQELTIASWFALNRLAPTVPWAPVLQGWRTDDYLSHAEAYLTAGVDLASAPAVGVGSVCRRQGTAEAIEIFRELQPLGLNLHGFGLKVTGLKNGASVLLASADSMAWSRQARFDPPMAGCAHKTCANCLLYAMRWRDKVLGAVESGYLNYQPTLF